MNASSLKSTGEMFDEFMLCGKFEENANMNVGSIICVNTIADRLQDVLTCISEGLAISYLNGASGRIKYEYDFDKSKLILSAWGTPDFLVNIILAANDIDYSAL